MRVLYIAPYKDASGYGEAARNYIRALQLHKIDLTVKAVKYDTFNEDMSEFRPLEKKAEGGYNILIEHLNPDEFGKYIPEGVQWNRRVGITTHETTNIPNRWLHKCNKMSLIVVPCKQNQIAFQSCVGLIPPVLVSPHCFDTLKYLREYPVVELEGVPKDKTVFYSIFQHSYKKGLDLLIPAFYMAFHDQPDDIALVLRTHNHGISKPKEAEYFKRYVHKIRDQFKFKRYPDILLLTGNLPTEQLYALHQACDIYISASRGEGWGIPCFDALGFGKTPIAADWGGVAEYLDDTVGYPLEFEMVPPIGMHDNEIYSINSLWAQPMTSSLIKNMRRAASENRTDKRIRSYKHVCKFGLAKNNLFTILSNLINEYSDNDQGVEQARLFPPSS